MKQIINFKQKLEECKENHSQGRKPSSYWGWWWLEPTPKRSLIGRSLTVMYTRPMGLATNVHSDSGWPQKTADVTKSTTNVKHGANKPANVPPAMVDMAWPAEDNVPSVESKPHPFLPLLKFRAVNTVRKNLAKVNSHAAHMMRTVLEVKKEITGKEDTDKENKAESKVKV